MVGVCQKSLHIKLEAKYKLLLLMCFMVMSINLQDARVSVLGSVPSLVKSWKAGNLTEGLDWTKIRQVATYTVRKHSPSSQAPAKEAKFL